MSEGARIAQRAAAGPGAAPAPRPALRSAPRVQRSTLRLSQPHDPSEREAEKVARQVVAVKLPLSPRERVAPLAARAPAAMPAWPVPQDEVSPELTAEIKTELGAGQTLAADTRTFLEPRFKASFAGVRIHTDGKAASIAARLGASAFTYGRDIFFANGRYDPDSAAGTELLAHELTHTIQQRGVVQRQPAPAAAAAGVLVTERSAPAVQRGIISRALDWIADKANYIPGYRMLTIVIGRNPINMEKVDRSGENILRALIEFIPGGHLIVEALENHGVIQKGGKFIEEQFAALGDLGGAIKDALMKFIDSLGWSDVFHLGDLWDRAKRIFTAPVDKAIAFGKNLVSGIASLVKEAIVKPLGRWAADNIPKWNLLVGVFGKNPISDEQESPAYALIGAFMELIGQQEIWENIKKSGAVGRAWNWFQKALKGALSLVTSIPGRVMSTLRSLTIFDIVTLVGAFRKVVGAFASFVGDFVRWAGSTVLDLLEIIFSVVAPSVVPYLKKAGSAFSTIIKAPGRFISTLVTAGKQGFNQFKTKIVTYLRDALFRWLLGSAEGAGLYFPKSFAPLELLKLALSVLGLTWTNIRGKLVAATNETTVKALETGFTLVKTLVTEGPAAAWQELLKTLSNLKSMVVDAAIDFVKGEVVRIAIEKLVSFLTPAGAFIQAVISIYRTISFIVSKLAQIGRLVAAFIDGIAALANGVVSAAANKVESVLATGLSLAINFLANFAGLGNIPKKVMDIIKKIRDPVDKALDRVVAWIVSAARQAGRLVAGAARSAAETARSAVGRVAGWLGKQWPFSGGGESHTLYFETAGTPRLFVRSVPQPIDEFIASLQQRLVAYEGAARNARERETAAAQRRTTTPIFNQLRSLAFQLTFRPGREPTERESEALMSAMIPLIRQLLSIIGTSQQRTEGEGQSIVLARYTINGESGVLAVPSGTVGEIGPFSALATRPNHPRHVDSEWQLLSHLANRFGTRPNLRDEQFIMPPQPDVRGNIHLASDFLICLSCRGVIAQFRRTFPKVNLIAFELGSTTPAERRAVRRAAN